MHHKSLVKNAMFNFMYTGLNLLFPLITSPYVSRILGASNLGKVNFATSIINWFILFATFGVTTYGVREVAKNRENTKKLNFLFSELVLINAILSLIVTIIYFVLIFNTKQFREELPLYLIMSLSIILNMFSIDWFYQGIEEYSYITIRSAIFKLISLICIFLFIRRPEHYVIYGLISVISISLSGILNFVYSKKYIQIKLRGIKPLRHIKSLSTFFFHTLVVSVYTNLDQTLLGFLVSTESVAYMNRSKVVINAAISVSTSISNVTLPRASYYIKKDYSKFQQLLTQVPNYILWITIPISVGSFILSPNIMFILGGNEFLNATILLQIISFTIILSPLSGYLQNQILIPTGNEKLGLLCAIISSFISVALNILLIPNLGYIGAGITILIAELSAVLLRYGIVKYKLGFNNLVFLNSSSLSYLVATLVMGIVVIFVKTLVMNMLISFFICAGTGVIIYFGTLILIKEEVTMNMLKKVKK